jgi:hypothetical protein
MALLFIWFMINGLKSVAIIFSSRWLYKKKLINKAIKIELLLQAVKKHFISNLQTVDNGGLNFYF